MPARKRAAWLRRAIFETLENRTLLSVSIINGGGLGYAGAGGGGPPDVTGAAGPNSYLEISNSTITLFNKPDGTILDQLGTYDFFYNPAIGNQSRIYSPTFNIAASPTGATETGTNVTITTTAAHGFVVGQSVTVSGVGVAGYNGNVKITGTPTATTFTYTAGTSGLADSGGGTVSGSSCGACDSTGIFDNLMGTDGRFIIGDIDVEDYQNVSQYIFAVSNSSNPTALDLANWNFYHITTTEGTPGATSWTDYPGNPGFNADALVETFDMFGALPRHTQVLSINADDLANGVPQSSLRFYSNDVPGGGQVYRATTMHDAVAGDSMWLIQNRNDGANINVTEMTNILSTSASFTTTTLALPAAYNFVVSGGISNPLNPDGTGMFDVGNRILKAGEYNDTIVAAHTVAVAAGANTLASAQANDYNGTPLGGSGYTIGDILTVNGGTFTTAAKLRVATIAAGGRITAVTVNVSGSYSSLSGVDGTVTGGTGTGASFSLFFTGELAAQWYAIDVSSGTPAFQQVGGVDNVGRVAFGANTYSYEPAIDINASGEIGLGFMGSDTVGGAIDASSGGYISTFVTARKPTDAAGTMQPAVLVPAGTGSGNINGRIGDFSGMNIDPVNGTFWHTNEYGGGATAIANFTPEDRPVVTAPLDQTGVEGASKSFDLGSFSDGDGSPWNVVVDWGDSSMTSFSTAAPGALGTRMHTYAEEGDYTVMVTVTDFTNLTDAATFAVSVSDPAVIAVGGYLVTSVEGQDSGSQTVATFTDPGGAEPLADYSAVIDWGDSSTSSGTISVLSGTFTVAGSHTYAEESAADHPGSNPYVITVTMAHESAPTAMALSSATVSDPAVIATGGFMVDAVRGAPLCDVPVATFTDPGGPEALADYSATIDWGDGTATSGGELSYDAGTQTYTVGGDHVYTGTGSDTITVTVHHENASDDVVVSSATVTAFGIGQGPCDADTLLIGGTLEEDRIRLVPQGTTDVKILIDGVTLGIVPLSAFSSIAIYGQDGNDDLQVDPGVLRTAFVFGGPGDDRLIGGGGLNYLDGGIGNDTLYGGGGRNVLIGGSGSDSLNAQGADDLLIAGSMDFEDYTNCDNAPMICLLFETWTDPVPDFSVRVAAVQALLAGHLINDSSIDTLNSGPGQDLIYLSDGDLLRGSLKGDIITTV